MLRRPQAVIHLTEDDLQIHLQRIVARSLPVNLDHLSLEETDENSADQTPTSEVQQPSINDPTGRLDPHRPLHGSTEDSSRMTRSSPAVARTHPAALPASMMMNGSTHRTIVDPNRASTAATAAQLISSNLPQTRASRPRETSPLPSPAHPRTELTIPPQEFLDPHILPSPDRKKENHWRSHPQDAWTLPNHDESRVSTSQSFRLSPTALPDLTINLVPQRDLALASTESYEAGLADTKVSPTMADTN